MGTTGISRGKSSCLECAGLFRSILKFSCRQYLHQICIKKTTLHLAFQRPDLRPLHSHKPKGTEDFPATSPQSLMLFLHFLPLFSQLFLLASLQHISYSLPIDGQQSGVPTWRLPDTHLIATITESVFLHKSAQRL